MPSPLHPALVHLPVGLALILPLLTIGFTWALWTGRIRLQTWTPIVILQSILLVAGVVALKTGQREEKRVEAAVPEAAIQTHEEYAEQFLWITGLTLGCALLVIVVRRPGATRPLAAATVLGTFLVAAGAIRVGHAGGQLVYVHNAGAAYVTANKAGAQIDKNAGAGAPQKTSDRDDND